MAGLFSQHCKTEIAFIPEFAMKLAVCWPKGNEGYLLLADDLCFQKHLSKKFVKERDNKEIRGLSWFYIKQQLDV